MHSFYDTDKKRYVFDDHERSAAVRKKKKNKQISVEDPYLSIMQDIKKRRLQ